MSPDNARQRPPVRRHEAPGPLGVVLPWTPYRLLVSMGGRTHVTNTTPNGTIKRAGYVRGPFIHILLAKAHGQMRDDAWALTRQAMGQVSWPPEQDVKLDIKIWTRTRASKDRDSAISGLKWCFDGISQALGVDDKHFAFGTVEFRKGTPEQTTVTLEVMR